jgi:energy-coupling factor transporter ATP-binding protein EcfA2
LKITRLRLLGFKSFVEPTEILIEPGLTGVVGPNGCGKSNLLEALRWAMGETSYKSMRGSAMEDVIFAGSQYRPARNTAEVTLLMVNKANGAGRVQHADDLVTRRIEREIGRPTGSTAGRPPRDPPVVRGRSDWRAPWALERQAASGDRQFRPQDAAACWKTPPALLACTAGAMRLSRLAPLKPILSASAMDRRARRV